MGDSMGALLLILALLPAFILVRELLSWYNHIYAVTSRRVMQLSGILNKRTSDSNLDKVNDVVLTQSWLGRILNYGTIDIITGSDVGVDRLELLVDPVEFKRVMMNNKEDFDTLSRLTTERLSQPPDAAEDPSTALERLASLRDRGFITEEEFKAKRADLLERL
jgi:uncharacterized membrane protein YdbT with pleckstrin-like domain